MSRKQDMKIQGKKRGSLQKIKGKKAKKVVVSHKRMEYLEKNRKNSREAYHKKQVAL